MISTFTTAIAAAARKAGLAALLSAATAASAIGFAAAAHATPDPGPRRNISFTVPAWNQITRLQTTFVVPPSPAPIGTVFLWLGLQPTPAGTNYEPIGNGVLQPVLTWGSSCAPTTQPEAHSSWWISAQYVNTLNAADSPYHGCRSGPSMLVSPGDVLSIDMKLVDNQWVQTVTRVTRAGSAGSQEVSFTIDLNLQAQNVAFFTIEQYDGASFTSPLVFSHTTITLAKPDASACVAAALTMKTPRGSASRPAPLAAGQQCAIDAISVS